MIHLTKLYNENTTFTNSVKFNDIIFKCKFIEQLHLKAGRHK